MPDEINVDKNEKSDASCALEGLEEYALSNKFVRNEDYRTIHNALEKEDDHFSLEETKRLLAVCVHDLTEDMRYTGIIMNILPIIISRVQMGKYDPCPNLLPSALAVIGLIKAIASLNKVEVLRQLCFDTLLSYPIDTLTAAVDHKNETLEIFNLYCNLRIPVETRIQTCSFLLRLLKILPPEKRSQFVAHGVSVWFSKIIPTVMNSVHNSDDSELVDLLETLTEELLPIDYTDNQHWHGVLECICSSQKYPMIMKQLLSAGNDVWHRLWIVFIRLLKHQITQTLGSIGTPINSMLPVVEAAFKVDVTNRCKAFECWNVLIDSFSTETNESNINKRIKLLIIPLKSNNAKVEATALAKFNCWWHLIQQFQNKVENFTDTILVSFLNFCFGKHNTDKAVLVPGQISMTLKKLCIKALVDIVGHVNCEGCTDLPKLSGKLISTQNLVVNWNHWVFSLTSAIMLSASTDNGLTKQQMTCLWKSFISTIGELPDNNIRKDLFSEILSILLLLVKECNCNATLTDIVFNALILSLFDGDLTTKQLLKTRTTEVNQPLCKLITVILDPSLHLAYLSVDFKEMVTKLRPVTDMLLDRDYSSPTFTMGFVLKNLHTSYKHTLTVWTALAESICENSTQICMKTLCSFMIWPLKSIHLFTHVEATAMLWYKLYDLFYQKLKMNDLVAAISTFLFIDKEVSQSITYFKLCVTLAVLKHKMVEASCKVCEKELDLLHTLSNSIDGYDAYEELLPILIDRVLATMGILESDHNEIVAKHILFCIKKIMTVTTDKCKQQTDASHHILPLLESVLKALDSLLKIEWYRKFCPIIVDYFIDYSPYLSGQPFTKNTTLALLKTITLKMDENDKKIKKIKAAIDTMENETPVSDSNQNSDINKFTTPSSKQVPKKTKRKEPSIVNTVVDNGEEYVVVKSNWKFNPRKLTENQKEKLQRKREDIPALYQDLSQSQDEFKLMAWKTDSQDTSNSSKSESKSFKSGSNVTATEILSNMPSSDVVPKILENFFAENVKKDITNAGKDILPADHNVNKANAVTPKNKKTARMALKDRVFRNVRNLIENSGIQKENQNALDALNKTETNIKTPIQSKSNDNVKNVNSAPSQLTADRPSRLKRKPKKFDELHLLTAKKYRRSSDDPKSKCQSKESKCDKSQLNTDTYKSDNIDNNINSPPVSVPNEEDSKPDSQVADKQMLSDTNEVIDSNESIQKRMSENNNETDKVSDVLTFDENQEKNTVNLSLDTSMDTNENKELPNKKAKDSKKTNESPINKEGETGNATEDNTCSIESDGVHKIPDEKSPVKHTDEINEEFNDSMREKQTSPTSKAAIAVSTPLPTKPKESVEQKSTTKKPRKSRIEKELAIDMVEGHPYLKMQSQKRLTRKALESVGTGRRKSLVEKLNKSKSEILGKSDKKSKEKNKESDSSSANSSIIVDDSQERYTEAKDQTSFTEDLPYSDDVIESSQDSSITTISVKSTKKVAKKIPIVALEKIKLVSDKSDSISESQSILDCVTISESEPAKGNQESKDDIELPVNKTALEKSQSNLTENLDTEPMDDKNLSEVIVINDNVTPPMTISSDETEVGSETQEIAEADTQPTDPNVFMEVDVVQENTNTSVPIVNITADEIIHDDKPANNNTSICVKQVDHSEDATVTLSESVVVELEKESGASSPSSFRDEAKRKQDFLNNTLEISPIKNMSPERTKKSPSPETSSDYVLITLSSPVHSNGEPFEKGSPEVFTEDKVSPDKRDQSPPRVEVTVTNTSPSSSLSLKKNKPPQVRAGGRAAQMLGLCCVPDKVQAIINQEKIETEEIKKANTSSTPARRNLRMLYNSVSENIEPPSENADSEHFLKLKRSLPAVDSSPSGPILKRKLVEITDDATVSPASKRKRVSFHDPPVSTTVSVHKYIEPGGVRSPQNSAQKRLERQMRQHTPIKSPKRLDHVFKLHTVLNKAVESFTESAGNATPDDTQPISLDETPVAEVVRPSELNDTDPLCPELIDCKDPIDNIATELSSAAMKSLLVKQLIGMVETVGDLAKMTELEVNRTCIKAPKVKVAKKALSDYLLKVEAKLPCDVMVTIDEAIFDEPMPDPELKYVDTEVQTVTTTSVEIEVQTVDSSTTVAFVQTETIPVAHSVVQTDESGSKSTADIVKLCLAERPDFVEQVSEHLEDSSIQRITDKLSFNAITDVLMKKVTPSDAKTLLNRVLEEQWNKTSDESRSNQELTFIREYMRDRFDSKNLILFCSDLLKSVYDKPAFL